MARGSALWYFGASVLTPFIVYWLLTLTGLEATLGFALAALVFIVTFPIAIAAWVYQDARDRGWSGVFWALVSILVPGGFLFYVFARMERRRWRASMTYVLYGIAYPVSLIILALVTGWGGILVVIGAIIWMAFALTMLNPQPAA